MKISDVTKYTNEPNILKSAHRVIQSTTAEGAWTNNIVPHGAIYPANDATATGIVFHNTEVDMPMAIIREGHIYADRLPELPTAEAVEALKQITFYDGDEGLFEPETGQ